MKNILAFIFFCTFAATVYAQDGHGAMQASSKIDTKKLSAADWQSDLRVLQQTVHKDYAFLFKKVTVEVFDAAIEKLNTAIPSMQDH